MGYSFQGSTLNVLLRDPLERIFSFFLSLSALPRELIQHSDFRLQEVEHAHQNWLPSRAPRDMASIVVVCRGTAYCAHSPGKPGPSIRWANLVWSHRGRPAPV